jgi:hypothetical protein
MLGDWFHSLVRKFVSKYSFNFPNVPLYHHLFFKCVLGMCYDYIFVTFYQMCYISCKQHDVYVVIIIEINSVQSFGWQREHIGL